MQRDELFPTHNVHFRHSAGMSPITIVNTCERDAGLPQVQRRQHHVRRVERVNKIWRETVSLFHRVRLQAKI